MTYEITKIEGIGPNFAGKLAPVNINTTDDLLELCCDSSGTP